MSKVGIVIPTVFERPEYLFEAIESIRTAGDAYILLLSPDKPEMVSQYIHLVDDHVLEEPDGNLAAKINHALNQLPPDCEFISWLGDDDLLTPQSIQRAVSALNENHKIALVYGSCDYIDAAGQRIGRNPSGNWAKRLMHFGPFLIPQPGSLWRRSTFEQLGGLDTRYGLAFDHDLFIRLNKESGSVFIPETQACFRWHPGSLSVKNRWMSVKEASLIRRRNYRRLTSLVLLPWELVVMLATKVSGELVSFRLGLRSKKGI